MAKRKAKPHELVVIQFDTPAPEASAAAVASMIHAMVALIEGAQQYLSPTQKVIVKARPLAPGSLQIPLDLIPLDWLQAGAQFIFENPPLLKSVLDLLSAYISARKTGKQGHALPPAAPGGIHVGGNVTLNNVGSSTL
jgi:hypothetical protein